MKFELLKEEEFLAFLNTHPLKSFIQLPQMAKYKSNHGWDTYFVGMKENETIVCASMIMANGNFFGKKMFYAPNGFLIDYENEELLKQFTKEIKKFVKKKKGYTLIIDPYYPLKERDINGEIVKNGYDHSDTIQRLEKLGYHYYGTSDQVKYMFVLDIEGKTEEQLLKEMKPNTRSCIQKSFKKGIVFRELSYEELEQFKKLTSDASEKHHFQDRSLEYYQEMYELFHKDNLIKYVVCEIHFHDYIKTIHQELLKIQEEMPKIKQEGKKRDALDQINQLTKREEEAKKLQKENGDILIISGAMFLLYGDEVIYLFSGNLKEHSHFCTAYRIQWEMIQYALKNNYKKYNFYGILSPDSKDGVYKFKKGFNGYVVELIGEFALPITYHFYLRKLIKKILKR